METLIVRRIGQTVPLLARVWHARRWWHRLRGLIARPPLAADEGMLFTPCSSVHTVGMRYALDLVFMDKGGRVLKCVPGLKPNRSVGAWRAHYTLELPAGGIARTRIQPGDVLNWASVNESNRASKKKHR